MKMFPIMRKDTKKMAAGWLKLRFGYKSIPRASIALYIISSQPSVVMISKSRGSANKIESKLRL